MDLRQHAEFLVEQLLREERARIREALLAWPASLGWQVMTEERFRAALDQLLPSDAPPPRIREGLLAAIAEKRREWGMPSEGVHDERELGATSAFAAVIQALDRLLPEEP